MSTDTAFRASGVYTEALGITPIFLRGMVKAQPCPQHSPEQNAGPLPESGWEASFRTDELPTSPWSPSLGGPQLQAK